MKRLITTLYAILCFYIFLGIIGIIGFIKELYILFHNSILESNLDITEVIFSFLKLWVVAYLMYHFYRFSRVVNKLEEKSFFNKVNGISFKKTGRAIILFVILNLTLSTIHTAIIKSNESFTKLPEEFVANIVLLMMALFLLIISHLIQNGYQLKKENELTI